MAKASDLLNKTGAASLPMQESPAAATPANPMDASPAKGKDDSVAAQRPDLGHNLHKGTDKSKGNTGGSSGRPKV